MNIRLGANPIIWSNDDLRELGGATPLEACLSEAAAIGFQGMELGHKFPREPRALRAALGPFGLACVSGWYSGALLERGAGREMDAMRAHLDLLKAMGSEVLIFAETSNAIHGDRARPLSQRPEMPAARWAEFGARLTELAGMAEDEGVRLVYHHHMGTVVQSAEDIDRLMGATGPAVRLLLDTGHCAFAGADPAAVAHRHRGRIGHVHAKDVRASVAARARERDASFLDAVLDGVFTVPSDGAVDFAAVFRELPGYAGWVVLEAEQDPEKAEPRRYADRGYRALRALLGMDR